MKHKNILIKIAAVETDIFNDQKTFHPVIKPEEDRFVYSEFLKIIDGKYNKMGEFLYGQDHIYVSGDTISDLRVGEQFVMQEDYKYRRRTSKVVEILTPNLFLTLNSLYFIKDEKFQIQQNRDDKLKKIIND